MMLILWEPMFCLFFYLPFILFIFLWTKTYLKLFASSLISFPSNYQRLTLKRLIDVSMGVITPLSEQLTKPLPNAMVLVNLKELSSGAFKLLPEGNLLCDNRVLWFHISYHRAQQLFLRWYICMLGTRLVVSLRGDEHYDELEILKKTDATMLLHNLPISEDKVSRVHAARR